MTVITKAPLPERVDVVVIGAGIVGAAAARSLAESGASVLVLERFERAHDRGSSHGATRIFRQGYDADDYVTLTSEALLGWRQLEAQTGRTLLETTGAIDHGDPAMLARIEAAMARGGVASERLTAAAAAERWPGLRFEGEVLHHPSGGRILSAAAIEALLDVAEAAGATLRFGVRVTGVEPVPATGGDAATDDSAVLEAAALAGVVVRTELGEVVARHVVVAAGSWTPDLVGALAERVGRPLPAIAVTQVQPVHFPTELPDDAWPSFVHYPAEGTSVYGLLTAGEGVKVGLHGGPVRVHPDERDGLADPEELARLTAYVASWVPGVDATAPHTISCLYDLSPSEDFVIDRIDRIIVTTGFSGHGFKFGPVLGRLVSDLVDGDAPHPRFALAAHAAIS
ncbi:MAG TPA: FAD-dependent oxidoreductase [Plantibacter sp.]|uniref:FAD-dependent oxidoreductase n=1 Tax=unclassified Plantibacter TaxID=2624265 RepID=UPI002D0357DB|nr:FAD-dependent oxidoreductase [Plantibacter sp.]